MSGAGPVGGGFAIWWLAQPDSERVYLLMEAGRLDALPAYIRDEAESRYGRAGRGRLWVATGIPLEEVPWDDADPVCQVASQAGGIVIHAADVPFVLALPGFVTDLTMRLWSALPDSGPER